MSAMQKEHRTTGLGAKTKLVWTHNMQNEGQQASEGGDV